MPSLLPNRDVAPAAAALAGVSEAEGEMDTPALTRTCRRQGDTLKDFEKKVEVGLRHAVKVIDGGAEFDVGKDGKKLLRIRITAEVDGVRSDYVITGAEPAMRPWASPWRGPTPPAAERQTPRGSPLW